MIRNILGMIAGGYTVDGILASYPDVTREDVAAALEDAVQVVDEDQVTFHTIMKVFLRTTPCPPQLDPHSPWLLP
jgi:Protein of unknown function (DUF433)